MSRLTDDEIDALGDRICEYIPSNKLDALAQLCQQAKLAPSPPVAALPEPMSDEQIDDLHKRWRAVRGRGGVNETQACDAICRKCGKNLGFIGSIKKITANMCADDGRVG